MQDADLDGLGGLEGPAQAHRGDGRAEGKGLDQTATLHSALSVEFECAGKADGDFGREL
ncbi:hypothetical protein D9M71_816170 [compost metagenome]